MTGDKRPRGALVSVFLLVIGFRLQAAANRSSTEPSQLSGSVVADTFWSQALGIRKRVMIWLPPSYPSQPQKRYPVAYYLHGAQGDETNWLNQGRLATTLDSLVVAGSPEMIVVMPDAFTLFNGSFYSNSATTGDWEKFIAVDLRKGDTVDAEVFAQQAHGHLLHLDRIPQGAEPVVQRHQELQAVFVHRTVIGPGF